MRRYSLRPIWRKRLYELTDTSKTNAGALLIDPDVVNMEGIEVTFRRIYRVKEPLASGAPVMI